MKCERELLFSDINERFQKRRETSTSRDDSRLRSCYFLNIYIFRFVLFFVWLNQNESTNTPDDCDP